MKASTRARACMDDASQVTERQRVCVWIYKILSQYFISSVCVALALLSPVVVNIRTLKGRFVAHKLCTSWTLGVVKSVEKKKSVAGQFAGISQKRITGLKN